ncbi:MAG TPA: hypothetical protein VG816_07455 [Solirubrobacterales bacterium]|nr:hypothetical protein [Solirubrobacterales bacterium]
MRGERRRRAFALLIAAVLAAALLGACGSGSEEGSDQFRDETSSPLLDFGEEASGEELEEGAAVVEDFFTARADGDWPTACAQLARPVLAKIEHLATSATDLEDKSCPSFLGAFTRLTAKEKEDSEIVEAGSLRRRGARAFLIYHGAKEAVYSMPLNREGDAWKLASLSADRLG